MMITSSTAVLATLLISFCAASPMPENETYYLSNSGIEHRQANDYDAAVRKGKEMWQMMINPPARAQRSNLRFEDLQQWGWEAKVERNPALIDERLGGVVERPGGLKLAYDAMHLQMELRINPTLVGVSTQHNAGFSRGRGRNYPATHAEYSAIYNPSQGAIVVYDEHSPAYRLQSSTTNNIPDISHPSDIFFLTYKHLAETINRPPSTDDNYLRYFFVRGITSQSQPTRDIIWRALRTVDGDLKAPPQGWGNAHMFRTPGNNGPRKKDDEPFYAVLGTMNFRTVAYMIAQYQDVFCGKVVRGIYVWGEGDYLHGLVHIG